MSLYGLFSASRELTAFPERPRQATRSVSSSRIAPSDATDLQGRCDPKSFSTSEEDGESLLVYRVANTKEYKRYVSVSWSGWFDCFVDYDNRVGV